MRPLANNRGSTLVEAIVALAVITMGIVALLTLCGVLLEGRRASESLFKQSVDLNTILDETTAAVTANPDKSETSVRATILSVAQDYEGWRCEVTALGKDLYQVQYYYSNGRGERFYEGRIYAEATP